MRAEQTAPGIYKLVIENVSASLITLLREKLTEMLTERTAVTWHFPIAGAALPKITETKKTVDLAGPRRDRHGEDEDLADEDEGEAEDELPRLHGSGTAKEERRDRRHGGAAGEGGKREILFKDFGTWLLSAARDPSAKLLKRVREEAALSSGKIVLEAFLRWSLEDGCRRRPMSDVVSALQTHLGLPKERFVAKAGKNEDMPTHARELETLWSRHLFHRAARLGKTVADIEPRHYGKNIRYYSAQLVLGKLAPIRGPPGL